MSKPEPPVVSDPLQELRDLRARVDAALACPGFMCSHCIEILTGEIPPTMTVKEYLRALNL